MGQLFSKAAKPSYTGRAIVTAEILEDLKGDITEVKHFANEFKRCESPETMKALLVEWDDRLGKAISELIKRMLEEESTKPEIQFAMNFVIGVLDSVWNLCENGALPEQIAKGLPSFFEMAEKNVKKLKIQSKNAFLSGIANVDIFNTIKIHRDKLAGYSKSSFPMDAFKSEQMITVMSGFMEAPLFHVHYLTSEAKLPKGMTVSLLVKSLAERKYDIGIDIEKKSVQGLSGVSCPPEYITYILACIHTVVAAELVASEIFDSSEVQE